MIGVPGLACWNTVIGGWPAFDDRPCAPFQPRVPHPCAVCKGGQRCCIHYRIGYDAIWITKFAPAFPTPALRKLREERGTRFVGAIKEIKGRATRPTFDRVLRAHQTQSLKLKRLIRLQWGPLRKREQTD